MAEDGVLDLALSTGKREQTKVANRQAILDAARLAFAEMGFEAVTVRDIIRRTGLSVGAFYNYFPSKETVFEALADDGARRFKPLIRAEYDKAESFEGFIRAVISAFFSFSLAEQKGWVAMRQAGGDQPHVRVKGPEQQAVFDEIKAVLVDGIDRGLAPRVDAEYLTAAAIGVAREVGDHMFTREPIDVAAATDFAVKMILGGVAALPLQGRDAQ